MKPSRSFRKTLLSASVASVLGLSASGAANATVYELNFAGAFTMLNSAGAPVANNPSPYVVYGYQYGWFGARTPITGSITYDDSTGIGSMIINGFLFFNSTPVATAQAYDITIRNIGNGTCTNNDPAQGCQPGNLILGNMLFNWNAAIPDYPVSNVWDASGMLGALAGAQLGDVITDTAGVLPASDGLNFELNAKKTPVFHPLGPAPMAVTTWNTTPNGCAPDCGGVNPSGILPLIADTIGASPIIGTSFSGFSPNFDIMTMTVECIDAACLNTPPTVANRMPEPDSTNIDPNANLIFTFTKKMNTATLANGAFSFKDSGGNDVPGTLIENSNTPGSASNYTFNPDDPLVDTFTYTATVTTAAQDVNGRALGAAASWSFTVGTPPAPGACTVVPQAPVGSNFTMINPVGETFPEGTNDIVYTIVDVDVAANLNDDVSDTNINMTLASARPQPFFGYTWVAHHVRVFGPGTYTFDTTCTVTEIEAGISACNHPLQTPPQGWNQFLTMTVLPGQIGAHMLFDWGQNDPNSPCGKANCNIDVVNVWDRNAVWKTNPLNLDPPPPAKVNKLFDDETWAGPAGLTVNPAATWAFVSTDPDGDGINGVKMVDGAFIGYGANFNLGANSSCLPGDLTVVNATESTSFPGGGCTISRNPTAVNVLDKSEWLLIGGFLAWLGAIRRRFRRQA
jgi:hypothetical protein